MSSQTKTTGPAPTKRDETIAKLATLKRATRDDLNVSASYLGALVAKGWLVVRDTLNRPGRGRPAYVYGLTDKGRSRARTLAKR